jgi:hypothetical protein
MTPDEFSAAFDAFRHSALRLETLQQYSVSAEDETVRAFREGLPRPERSLRTSPWLQRIATTTMAGKTWTRIRLVRHPLTEYVRLELLAYIESAAVGEQIRIVDLDQHPELASLGPDFWLFDADEPDEFAICIHYHDADGSVRGYERINHISWCKDQRDAALRGSISLAEYLVRGDR